MPNRALIVDANILVRAVLGKRIGQVIEAYAEDVSFFVPEVAFFEAEEHLPALIIKRGNDPEKALAFSHTLGRLERLGQRDPEDWPILAASLALGCPIWIEDTDFFGCGIATWTSSSVQKYLHASQK